MENKKIPEDLVKAIENVLSGYPWAGTKETPIIIKQIENAYNKPKYSPLIEKVWEEAKDGHYCQTFQGYAILTKDNLNNALEGIVEVPEYCDEMVNDFLHAAPDGIFMCKNLSCPSEGIRKVLKNMKARKYSKQLWQTLI